MLRYFIGSLAKLAVIGLGFLSFAADMLRFGIPCIYLSSVDSSNNYIAKHDDVQSLAEGTAIMAYDQTAGRGQFTKNWEMNPGKDLAVSYLLRPDIAPSVSYVLNKAISIGVRSAVSDLIGASAFVKWPNDILVKGKKVAGLLIEPVWQGAVSKHVVIGIGLNVNGDFSKKTYAATSLLKETGQKFNLDDVFETLSASLSNMYELFNSESYEEIEGLYESKLYGLGEEVTYRASENIGPHKSMINGVDRMGRILIRSGDDVKAYPHGSIQIDYSRIESQ